MVSGDRELTALTDAAFATAGAISGVTGELAALLPAATVTELAGSGHGALHQAPGVLAAGLLGFLSASGAAG
ncbi:MAG TPA: hypothetical protein VFV41_08330 [Streptosporangiaceae bacterium]|nr:hypothetical protein [Streptosporangiaceae bacterium]